MGRRERQKAIQYLGKNPTAFVEEVIFRPQRNDFELEEWQAEALQALSRGKNVSVRSGHGVGKTTLASWAIMWFGLTRPYAQIPCTAPTQAQLKDRLWARLARWYSGTALEQNFELTASQYYNKNHKQSWFAVAHSSNEPENMAGFHADNLLYIIDEASGVDDAIFEAILGATTESNASLLLLGNPTRNGGFFAKTHREQRDMWATFHVSSIESSLVTDEYVERMARIYGRDSDPFRVRVIGEFPEQDDDAYITLNIIENAEHRELSGEIEDYEILHVGEDVAGRSGEGDENVVAGRVGPVVVGLRTDRGLNTKEKAGMALRAARDWAEEYSCPKVKIKVDDTGIGEGVTDEVEEQSVQNEEVYGIKSGANPSKDGKEYYRNCGDEMWGIIRKRGDDGRLDLPSDDTLISQFSERHYGLTASGKVKLESKKSMKERGLTSPDRADATALAFYERQLHRFKSSTTTTVNAEVV